MYKIWVILKREYLTRVKNKTFIIMTFLGPVLIGLFYAGIFLVASQDAGDKTKKQILYSDHSGFYKLNADTFENYTFVDSVPDKFEALQAVASGKYDGLLEINDKSLDKIDSINWVSKKTLSVIQSERISNWLANKVYFSRLHELGFSKGKVDSLKPTLSINTVEIDEKGNLKSSSSIVKSGIGMFLAFVVYLFIFIYGAMIMRSTLEEKTNRIVEVIISSIKPFQLMMGKILGVALVGLTQFVAWIILSIGLIIGISSAMGAGALKHAENIKTGLPPDTTKMMAQSKAINVVTDSLMNLPFGQIIFIFLVFFVCGFLLYSSMFAAVGSAANQETDTQQFMLPISMPLVFGFVIAQSAVLQDPHGPMARIFSMIPFTSPVVMMVRSPFGVPWSDIIISALILIGTFVLFVWITGRIYRIGILMYGKKPSWKQLGKWIFSKN